MTAFPKAIFMDLKVLIVDDDQIVVFTQKKMMERHVISCDPMVFRRAEPALDYLAENNNGRNHFLILLDINMPAMNGWEFLRKMEDLPEKEIFHVILITSSVEQKDKEKARRYSTVRDFLEKPITTLDCQRIKRIPELSPFFED